MLILALGGVVVGFAFLVVSLLTENSTWAWGCIVACALAAGVLVVDARRRRRPAAVASPEAVAADPVLVQDTPTEVIATAPEPAPAEPVAAEVPTEVIARTPAEPVAAAELAAVEPVVVVPDAEPVIVPTATVEPAAVEPAAVEDTAEPEEEDADASDALVVAGLEQDVLVVDEHPRFHVATCTWLVGRETMGLPAREAVELGFTPCSRCAPARTLASLART